MEKTENQERTAVAGMRSILYGFLATVYRQEVTSDLLRKIKDPQFLGVLADLGVDWSGDFSQEPEKEMLEDLAVEYARLFVGPGKHISPHESVHHEREDGDWGRLWGAATVEVKAFIEVTGLGYDDSYKGMPDHISAELELMEKLTENESQAWSGDDEEGARQCVDVERRFIEEHLIHWVPTFCDKVIEAAELSFYRELAALTKRFIELEQEEVKG